MVGLDFSGNRLWVRFLKGEGYDFINSVVVDENDNVWVGGSIGGNAQVPKEGVVITQQFTSAVAVKYTKDGDYLQYLSADSSSIEQIMCLATNGSMLYAVGYTSGSNLAGKTLRNSGGNDGFLIEVESIPFVICKEILLYELYY